MISLLEQAKSRAYACKSREPGTITAGGLALSPYHAAGLVSDLDRINAIWSALKKWTAGINTPGTILYAGCGPVAPLVLPLLDETDWRVHCVDIHAAALESAKHALAPWRERVTFEQGDLTNWQWFRPGCEKPKIIVCETLNAGLLGEPQIAIWRNLYPQFPAAAFVPCAVAVKFEPGGVAIFTPAENTPPPIEFVAGEKGVEIQTVVEMYPGVWLHNSNSPLNTPVNIRVARGSGVAEYVSSAKPGWTFKHNRG